VKLSVLANPAGGKTAGDGKGIPASGMKTGEARPVSIAVTSGAGAHYGSKYDLDIIDDIYENAILIFRDALGTAQTPEKPLERTGAPRFWRRRLF
jgi:hypothetical protein